MKNIRDGVVKQIDTVLRHFSLDQLKYIVFPELDILKWHKVRELVLKEQLPLDKASFIKVMVFAIKKLKSRDESFVRTILHVFRILAIAVHHYHYKWTAFVMSEKSSKHYYTCSDIQDSIETSFCKKRRLVEVIVIACGEAFWIGLFERNRDKKRKLLYKAPIFVAHFPGQPYFFISQNGKKEDILDVISRALGYKDAQDCSLSGQNVDHLLRFLKNRESDACNAEDVLQGDKRHTPALVETSEGDFTNKKNRIKYADACFGNGARFQQLTVQSSSCQWNIADIVPESAGETFGSPEVQFRSPDVIEMLKEMYMMGIISTPLPEFVQDIKKKGMNKFILKNNEEIPKD